MRSYRDILTADAGRLILIAGCARLSWGIEGLALIFHVEEAAGSFAAAGIATGALGVTSAALAPVRGRIVDRAGAPAMLFMSVATAAVIAALALTPAVGPEALSYIVLAGLTGVVAPPFTAWTRTALAARLDPATLKGAYTIDNIFEESAFVVGPLLAGVVIAIGSPAAALLVAAALAGGGGLVLTLAPRLGEWRPPLREARAGRRAPLNRPLALAFLCLGGLGAGIGFIEVAIAAFAEARGSEGAAGAVLAALSAGGIVGALVYGARRWPGSNALHYAVLLAFIGVGLAALAIPDSIAALAVITAVAGLALTPVFIVNSLLIEELSPGGPTAAAFAVISTSMNGGVAAGVALGGAIVDGNGTDLAFLAAGTVVVLSAALAAVALPFHQPVTPS
jgi:predicted MFS family arabinose efflux permease